MSMAIHLKLREFLGSNNLRAATVEQTARNKLALSLGENTIYRMMKNSEPKKLDMEALNAILASTSYLLGRTVNISELLEYRDGSSQS